MRVLLWVLAAVVLVLAVAWFGGRWYLSLSAAGYDGERRVAGLGQPVEVTFDAMGIPQIWAETDSDAYFTLGFLHASERLFQMELARRMSSGTLSEMFGEDAFHTDVRQRRIGFHRLGERALGDLDVRTRRLLEAYVAGINQRIDAARVLPPEFVVLRFRPRHWTVLDVLTLFVYQSWYPTELSDRSARNERLVAALGPEVAEMLSAEKPWTLPSVPEDFLESVFAGDGFPLTMTTATNNWALAPERSASGRALHAADPHLAVNSVPGYWYVARLHSGEGTNVLGITVPGVPVFAMGHNGEVAWSFSVAPMVLVDHYSEVFLEVDPLQVRTPEGWAPVEVVSEEIVVKGEDAPRIVEVLRTPRGVVVEHHGSTGLSMHWSGYDLVRGEAVAAALAIPEVTSFEAFRTTVTGIPWFSVNWIYSDRAGNIGYQLGASIPRRTYNPFLQQDADDPDAAWDGYHPLEMAPWALNPEQGWLATTNNQPAPPDWPVDVPGNYNQLRIKRVEAWMGSREVFGRAEMERMQLDFTSEQALQWRELMAAGAGRLERPDLAAAFRAWSGELAVDDTLATVFVYWWDSLTRHLFEDRLGPRWRDGATLREIVLFENRTDLIDDIRTPERESAADISARAMADALERADGRRLGEVQSLTIRHPLSRAPILDRWLGLDRGPFPRGGDIESLNLSATTYLSEPDRFAVTVAASMRYVMDWADVDGFTIEIPLGQSGNPFSRHYDDFLELERRGERWVVPFSREAVEARAASRLRLRPEG